MGEMVEIKEWLVGLRVGLPKDAPDGLINKLGALAGMFGRYFGEQAHPELLPITRHLHQATLFYEQHGVDHEEVIHEAALMIVSVTAELPPTTTRVLHVSPYYLLGSRPHDEALFSEMLDYSDALIPPQRIAS
jgi:hypothetical protein